MVSRYISFIFYILIRFRAAIFGMLSCCHFYDYQHTLKRNLINLSTIPCPSLINKNTPACYPYVNLRDSLNLSFKFAILTLVRNILRCKILILNIITINTVHWWKPLGSWDMPELTHKSWKPKIQFLWNRSITLKYIDDIKKFNFYTAF